MRGAQYKAVNNDPKAMLERCETLMLDMDGTVLDLAFDNYMWLHHVPEQYAETHGMAPDEARRQLYAKFEEMLGQLKWYCLDHWSDFLGLDVAQLHRDLNHRIGYLPGAEDFLKRVAAHDVRLLLVTNSHLEVLEIKHEVTGIKEHFHGIHSSHEFGAPKESQDFWHALKEAEGFDVETTLFVDDTHRVLDSAAEFGLDMLVHITRPDTSQPHKHHDDIAGVEGVSELID